MSNPTDQNAEAPAAPPAEAPLRSVATTSFGEILSRQGLTLLVSTYQAGKLVMVRADEGKVNTHFRNFHRPMGVAVANNRLAVGTTHGICEFLNVPAVVNRLEPPGKHDACFVPRMVHTTGDVAIHEMAWVGEDLWFVNTRFSCLCVRHPNYSFVPRWRPPFISALSPEDRCHLNGLGLRDGRPRYVTALGEKDQAGSWRENKKDGGLVMDLANNQVLLRGLSMPHSPRWYDNRLWLLESGNGGIGFVDPGSGKYQNIAQLPGFTRGLDFLGPLAFIGLSQVRESATFSGIAIAERSLQERACGVWVVNIQTGQTVAFLKFEDAVQEIFAVQLLPGIRYPELINDDLKIIGSTYVLPDEALTAVPEALRQSGPGKGQGKP